MQKHIINLAIALLLTSVSSGVVAKAGKAIHSPVVKHKTMEVKPAAKTKTLKSFIDKKCSKKCVDESKLSNTIAKASTKYQVNRNVILGVITVESAFNSKAVSSCGVGLMQVCPKWHREKLKGSNPYTVSTNVDVGTQILKQCLEKHKQNINRSLACYNGGGDAFYVTKVRAVMKEIEQLAKTETEGGTKWL